jgi:hypothetical protein
MNVKLKLNASHGLAKVCPLLSLQISDLELYENLLWETIAYSDIRKSERNI